MNIELSRFRVIKGKEAVAYEWMTFLKDNLEAVIQTLEGERMYVETIFEEQDEEYMYLYWYSIQGEGGTLVTDSQHEVDKKHLKYWRECIDQTYKPVHMKHHLSMIPKRVQHSF